MVRARKAGMRPWRAWNTVGRATEGMCAGKLKKKKTIKKSMLVT